MLPHFLHGIESLSVYNRRLSVFKNFPFVFRMKRHFFAFEQLPICLKINSAARICHLNENISYRRIVPYTNLKMNAVFMTIEKEVAAICATSFSRTRCFYFYFLVFPKIKYLIQCFLILVSYIDNSVFVKV